MTTRTGASRVAWFHCYAGIAGDMALASLVDAGADFDEIRSMLDRLAIKGWIIDPEPVLRSGIAATHLRFEAKGDGVVRTLSQVTELIDEAKLPSQVRERSLSAFAALATTEARLHRSDPQTVHFHELAGYDTILDIVGTMAALEILDIDNVVVSPVALGTGLITTQHGVLPNPGPAVVELLRNALVVGRDIDVELTTPTGAAIVATLATSFGAMPAMQISRSGYGAGTTDIEGLANCTQVVIGTTDKTGSDSGQPLVLLAANLDDATGELLSDTIAALIQAGAADAWITPVVMKKGRPGHIVNALCDVGLAPKLRAIIVTESGSFGVRSHMVDRWATARHFESVIVEGHRIAIKVSADRAKVEHDDALSAAKALGLSVREITMRAEAAWQKGRR